MSFMRVEHRTIVANGVSLHVALAGPTHGPLVILLYFAEASHWLPHDEADAVRAELLRFLKD
jgi:hypothetical protein